MQRDLLADEVRQHRQRLALLVEEEVDDVGRGEHAELLGVELARLAHQLAQDLVAHGARGLDLAAAAAGRARLAQQVGERFAGALAGHLHQAERGEAVDRHLGVVARQRLAELLEHHLAVLDVLHVDEVDDDDAAEVAQAQLAGDGLAGFEVGLEDGVVEDARTDEAAGVDVDRGHRFGLVDDQVAPRFQVHASRQRLLDFLFDIVELEQRTLAAVVLEQGQHLGRVFGGEGGELLEVLPRVDADAVGFVVDQVAQGALPEAKILVQQLGRKQSHGGTGNLAPQLAQVGDVGGEFRVRCGLGHGAHDEATGLVLGYQRRKSPAQGFAPRLVLDALGDADVLFLRQIDEQAASQADLRGQACALGADRILEHLHHQALAFGEDLLDRPRRFAVLAVAPDIGHMQEGGALQADVDVSLVI